MELQAVLIFVALRINYDGCDAMPVVMEVVILRWFWQILVLFV